MLFSKLSSRIYGAPSALTFLLSVLLTSLINIGFIIFIFVNFEINITDSKEDRTIPTYLAIFLFAQVYQILLAWNAIRNQNVIQIIGMCIFYAALIAYAGIQYNEISDETQRLSGANIYNPSDWNLMRAFIIAVPCVLGVAWLICIFLTIKLYREFGWSIYKNLGADISLKRRYLAYLIYETLLKFDFFFFLGFTIQFLVIVSGVRRIEFILTIIVIPLTIIFLYLAIFVTKRESKLGMIGIILIFFAGLAYFLFKLVRMYQPSEEDKYLATRKTLTAFAVFTITLLVCSIVNASICMINFNKGLKRVIYKSKSNHTDNADDSEEKYPMVSYGEDHRHSNYDLNEYATKSSNRLEID